MIHLLWLFPLGALMNWLIRGGGYKSAFFNNKPPFSLPGDVINAIVYGGVTWCLSGSMGGAVFASIAMYAGSAPGLGAYVSAMRSENPDKDWFWGVEMMTLRGGFWGLCLALPSVYFWISGVPGVIVFALAVIAAGVWQGFIYFGFIKLFEKRPYNLTINHWTCSEMLHGGLIWACLLFIKQ